MAHHFGKGIKWSFAAIRLISSDSYSGSMLFVPKFHVLLHNLQPARITNPHI